MIRMTDTSHFRAPYKNAVFSGLGEDLSTPPDLSKIVTTAPNGARTFLPETAQAILTSMEGMAVIHLDNDTVKVEPMLKDDVRERASAWIARHLAEGKTILAGSPAGVYAVTMPADPGIEKFLAAGNDAFVKDKAGTDTMAMYAVLVKPTPGPMPGSSKAGMLGGLGPIGVAVVAVAGVGGLVWLLRGKKKKA